MVLAHIIVEGDVQGIGYRYFVRRTAQSLNLKGWVRNLLDGNVEIEVEGEKSAIDEFIMRIKSDHPWAHILDLKIAWSDTVKGYKEFSIKF